MDLTPSDPQALWKPPRRRGTSLPLRPLVEERRGASTPGHLLDSKNDAELKRNGRIEVAPSELHFSGFELGKKYVQVLKIINISCEAVNFHIIPTQTRYFQTTYTRKNRLIPGLDLTVKVTFCPDKWRHFNDCIRVRCKDEDDGLVPIHGYPVIDDLHIPPRIDLPAVPLGQSYCQVIRMRSSCPVDFEFQLFVIQQHEAFSLHPLKGVISASGKAKISVTFTPQQYETSHFTFQLVVSQFNTKPYLCTVTGSSWPHLALSQLEASPGLAGDKRLPPIAKRSPRRKSIPRSSKDADNLKKDQSDVGHRPTPPADIFTHAGVAKMLIKDVNKPSSKHLKQALPSVSTTGPQSRQMKEALFVKKLQQFEKEEEASRLRWQVRLGSDPMSEETRLRTLAERTSQHECTVKEEAEKVAEAFASLTTKLSSTRVIRDVGQPPDGVPSFQRYTSISWEQKELALKRFQQAARQIVIRCRMNPRLAALKTLTDSLKNPPPVQKAETPVIKLTMDPIFPRSFTIVSDEAPENLDEFEVPLEVKVTRRVPFLKLEVPQRYKLMGYEPVSSLDAFENYIPATLARPLRSGPPEELEPVDLRRAELKLEDEDKFSFKAPDALLRPFPANPLRIFNPAPGLQTYKPTPKYLECDPDFHFCPIPKYKYPEPETSTSRRVRTVQTFLDLEVISFQGSSTTTLIFSRSYPLLLPPPFHLLRGTRKNAVHTAERLLGSQVIRVSTLHRRPLVQRGAALVSHSNATRQVRCTNPTPNPGLQLRPPSTEGFEYGEYYVGDGSRVPVRGRG
ncbi:cilia- and flagella-associated protein 221 [Nematolebias whitei]|uniref:cilia- and flagella-associated protein 221 n=1 Tax=Nematolebias whitei TaxID=451745 RepID=UPI00189935B4|nr:cilia- and flagella-associated protein 221 [Nematolebias whitei]